MSKIKPALTPEEWARSLSGPTSQYAADVLTQEPGIHGDDVVLDVIADWDGDHGLVLDRHAAAALCLHGQPFGFTHEDVELVQIWIDAKKHSDQLQGFVARMIGLRDRIEALLPPDTR